MSKRSQTLYLEDGTKQEVNLDTEYVEQSMEAHVEEHTGSEPEPSIDDTLLEIPEIKMLVTYYHTRIQEVTADTRMQPFMKKMKLKALPEGIQIYRNWNARHYTPVEEARNRS